MIMSVLYNAFHCFLKCLDITVFKYSLYVSAESEVFVRAQFVLPCFRVCVINSICRVATTLGMKYNCYGFFVELYLMLI